MDTTLTTELAEPVKKARKPSKGSLMPVGNLANHVATTWDDLIEQSYSHLNLDSLERAFESDTELLKQEQERIDRENRKRVSKGFTTLGSISIPDDRDPYGAPRPVRPQYHPLVLRDLAEHDPDVSAGLDCLAVNIGEVPYILEPALRIETFTDESGKQKRRFVDTGDEVTDTLWKEMQAQARKIRSFVDNLCPAKTFRELRYDQVYNTEQIGSKFWEALRNSRTQELMGFKPIEDDATIRLCKEDDEPIDFTFKAFEGFDLVETEMPWKFRRYVQTNGYKKRYYKSYGDPRFLDRETGRYYESAAEAPHDAKDATELYHFKLHGIDYGRPRWAAAAYSVQTNKAAQLTNRETMNNSGVPKMVMVLLNCSDETLETQIKQNIKSIKNAGSKEMVMVVRLKPEEVGVGNLAQPVSTDFRIERLSNQQEKEGLYLDMQRHNQANIATTLRLPDLLYGRSVDSMNRATAFIMMSTVEKQVFAPARQRFDEFMNRVVFVEKGFNFWRFRSQSGDLNDAELYIRLLQVFGEYGGIVPDELRTLGPELLDVDLMPLDPKKHPWAQQPRYISTMKTLVDKPDDNPLPDSDSETDDEENATKRLNLSEDTLFANFGKQVLKNLGVGLEDADVFLYAPGRC